MVGVYGRGVWWRSRETLILLSKSKHFGSKPLKNHAFWIVFVGERKNIDFTKQIKAFSPENLKK